MSKIKISKLDLAKFVATNSVTSKLITFVNDEEVESEVTFTSRGTLIKVKGKRVVDIIDTNEYWKKGVQIG